jgi:hypothetical protein
MIVFRFWLNLDTCLSKLFLFRFSLIFLLPIPYFVQYDDVEVGEDEARAARTERTPFRRNLRRPTVPPPSVNMVRPVRKFLYLLLFFSVVFLVKRKPFKLHY